MPWRFEFLVDSAADDAEVLPQTKGERRLIRCLLVQLRVAKLCHCVRPGLLVAIPAGQLQLALRAGRGVPEGLGWLRGRTRQSYPTRPLGQ